jgi:hypothetical protein
MSASVLSGLVLTAVPEGSWTIERPCIGSPSHIIIYSSIVASLPAYFRLQNSDLGLLFIKLLYCFVW